MELASPFILSAKLAGFTTLILFAVCLPIAYGLAFGRFSMKPAVESILSLPMVLPPTVLGFYLLILLSPNFIAGRFLKDHFGISLLFNFPGIVIASCVYTFPYMLQPLKNGFEGIEKSIIEAAYTLGKTRLQTLAGVILPNMKPAILTACITTFAHTVGGFGVVLMTGGNIDRVTRVVSIAIYEKVEELDYAAAHIYSGSLLVICFAALVSVHVINRASGEKR